MPPDHPAWMAVNPLMAFPDPLKPYSLIFFSGFDKEEYANFPSEEDDEVTDGGANVAEPEVRDKADRAEGHSKFGTQVSCEYLSVYLLSALPCEVLDNPELGAQAAQRPSHAHADLDEQALNMP
ncbi:hypothetical protein Acr_07g0016640 [Actinidia rufa]|uniref:Uncharacterized protein n=1 Tax=Actinidia rufa TaxID=165716 RepID=A0A7J0EYI1_9ERIC|nr:hypothetical protein Acr_07g0016640 [Actinidia rufa]